jgi:pilus assembly protein Flp/PilA
MQKLIQKFINDESGATMVEYGVMIALIAAIAVGTVAILGGYVNGAFDAVNTSLGAAGVPSKP